MENLTTRLKRILFSVIESYVATGKPVGSKYVCQNESFELAPSTMRSELAKLEHLGYLKHPYTSAGRMPTDKGYRFYVDNTVRNRNQVEAKKGRPCRLENVTYLMEGEIEDALKHAAGILAGSTGMLALVSAPSQDDIAIKHVEVLQMHPDLVMVVVITESGGIKKKQISFDQSVDIGLVEWARCFLNETVCGLDLGSLRLKLSLEEPDFSPAEESFVAAIAPTFTELSEGANLYVDGVSRFFARLEEDGSSQVQYLMKLLDRQEEFLSLLKDALSESNIYLKIGHELTRPNMKDCSFVAANYGFAHRNLGTVGVLGPTRMDYIAVIGSVRNTASSLNRFVEEIYQ